MSYAWRIAGDAFADLRELEPALQEDVLDELDRLAAEPSKLRADRAGCAVHDFERVLPPARYIAFVRLHRDDQRKVLSILSVAARRRQRPILP